MKPAKWEKDVAGPYWWRAYPTVESLVGLPVALKSGGPQMTVMDACQWADGIFLCCRWRTHAPDGFTAVNVGEFHVATVRLL